MKIMQNSRRPLALQVTIDKRLEKVETSIKSTYVAASASKMVPYNFIYFYSNFDNRDILANWESLIFQEVQILHLNGSYGSSS